MNELWQSLLARYSDFTLFTIAPTVLVNLVYVIGSLVCLSFDHIPQLRKYKIQPGRYTPAQKMWACARHLVLIKLLIEIPLTLSSYPLLRAVGVSSALPLPGASKIALQIILFFFIEDAWHYFAHRLLHVRWFYKKIHYLHHTYSTPFGMQANYAHPGETLWLGFGTILPILLFGPHLLTMWLWIMIRQAQAISVHTGYDFPFSLRRWVPLVGGTAFHDRHHTKYNYNFAPLFTHLDWLLGTAWRPENDPRGR